MVTIYVLRDPRTAEIRYVGATKDVEKRMKEHTSGRCTARNLSAWLSDLEKDGYLPVMEVVEVIQPMLAGSAEKRWIRHFRKRCALVNMAMNGWRNTKRPTPSGEHVLWHSY
jgi:hypothetical protein